MIFVFLLIIPLASAYIHIDEIMYDPQGNDNNNEYVEVYLENIVNLSNYTFQDKSSYDYLEEFQFYEDSHYALIVESGFNFSGINASIYSTGATIGNNLNNDDDFVIIKDQQGNIMDLVHYYSEWGARGNGMSLCKLENIWNECHKTPGMGNAVYVGNFVQRVIDGDTFILNNEERVRLIGVDTPEMGEYYYLEAKNRLKNLIEGKYVYLESDEEDKDRYERLLRYVYINNTFVNLVLVEEGFALAYPYAPNLKYEYEFANAEEEAKNRGIGIWDIHPFYVSSLKINEFMPNPKGYDDAQMPQGEWVEVYNKGEFDLDLNGLRLKDNSNHQLIISDVRTLNGTLIKSNNYLTIYMNGFSGFLNNEGFEKIMLYKGNYLIDEISYSDGIEGLSWSKVGDYWIKTIPTPGDKNRLEEPHYSSNIKIDNIYLGKDNKAKFGENIRARIQIYKGNTTKYNLDLYIIDDNNRQISKRSEINVEEGFVNYTLVVPVQIESNCEGGYPDGIYSLVLKGLDDIDVKKFEIEGFNENLCKEIKLKENSVENIKELSEPNSLSLEQDRDIITSSIIYKSSDIKARDNGIFFFCGVLLLLIIYLVFWKTL